MPIRVMLTDDHQIVVNGLKGILVKYKDIKVIASYHKGEDLLNGLKKEQPDVLILDIQLPDFTGTELLRKIIQKYPALKVLILSSLDNIFYIKEAMQHGAYGYLTKFASEDVLLTAIRTIYSGETFLEKNVREELFENMFKSKKATQALLLTRREKQILKLILAEKTNVEIGEQLFISARTVEAHRQSLIQKLGVKNTVGLVKTAIHLGLSTQ